MPLYATLKITTTVTQPQRQNASKWHKPKWHNACASLEPTVLHPVHPWSRGFTLSKAPKKCRTVVTVWQLWQCGKWTQPKHNLNRKTLHTVTNHTVTTLVPVWGLLSQWSRYLKPQWSRGRLDKAFTHNHAATHQSKLTSIDFPFTFNLLSID